MTDRELEELILTKRDCKRLNFTDPDYIREFFDEDFPGYSVGN